MLDTTAMIQALAQRFLPSTTVQFKPAGGGEDLAAVAPPFMALLEMRGGRATAYVCSGQACAAPAVGVEAMMRALERGGDQHDN